MALNALSTNVVRLPTAAPRKVQQRYNRYMREFRAANPWPGDHQRPESRYASSISQTPELLIAMAVFKCLTDEQKAQARHMVMQVHLMSPNDESLAAFKVVTDLK